MRTIIALDTATENCSAALWYQDKLTSVSELALHRHAELILKMIDELLQKSKVNREQIDYFLEVAKDFTGDLCLANSAGILFWPKSHTKWVRPGVILYGISPFADRVGSDFQLEPVMTLRSSLIAIRKIKKGAKVGYGAAWTAPCDTTLGIVSTGYGDGYPRTAPNGTPVWVNGRIVPSVGHVCMDMMFVDLGPNAQDKIGDKVVLWGKEVPVEKVAALCGTIPYELVCHIMPRVEIANLS